MIANQSPGPHLYIRARALLDEALQGAEANDRPDLTARLRTAQAALSASAARYGDGEDAAAVRGAAEQTLRALDSMESDLRARRAMLADPARAARLHAELADAQARHDRFTAASAEWQFVIGEGFAAVGSELDSSLRTQVLALLRDAELAINSGDPVKNRSSLRTWVRGRMVAEAERAYQRLLTGAHDVTDQVASQLDLPHPHRVHAPRVTPPEQLVAELSPSAPAHGHTPIPARLLTVFMPAYGGIMMALVLSRLLDVRLPGWLIAVCAVVGALSMGGAAAIGERSRHRDRRRAEAMSAIRITAEEYQLALTRQLRAATRVLQHDLRRATAEAVTRRGALFAEELDRVRAAVDAARSARDAQAEIDEDRDLIAGLRREALALLRAPSPTRDDSRPKLTLLPTAAALPAG